MTDLVIRGGSVLDGTGSPAVVGDLRVAHHRVVEDPVAVDARALDATGCWVLPGFVDLHAHTDLAVLTGEGMTARHHAGITTEVVGQDGLGFVPGSEETVATVTELMRAVAGTSTDHRWDSTAAYLEVVARHAVSHVATLASHGTARIEVAGTEGRPLTPVELERLAVLCDDAARQGAVGLSTGLSYPPARSSDTDEVVTAYRPFAARGLPYVTHLRDYGTGFEAALDEAVEIATRAQGHLHLSHLHVSGPGRAGTAAAQLARLEDRASDLPLTWDSYPYTAACTFLASFLPDDVVQRPRDERRRWLRDQGEQVAAQLDERGPGATVAVGWDAFLLAGTGRDDLDGRPLVAAAEAGGRTAGQLVVELCQDREVAVLIEQGHLDNVRTLATDPRHRGGSDGIMGAGVPHPRATGTFLRWLRWVRDDVVAVPLPEMVRRLTSAAADVVALHEVGRLTPGALADVVVIDPERLDDGPDHHLAVPDAVRHLVVGGRPVIVDGHHRGPSPVGRALRWS